MAFRRPLYQTNGNLQEISDSHLNDIKSQLYSQYVSNPAVALNVVGGGGNLGTYYDTRLQAGSYMSYVDRYPYEWETPEPSVNTYGYSRIDESYAQISAPADTNNVGFPLYYDGSNLRAMSYQDVLDTFIYPVIDWLVVPDAVYTVSTSSGLSGWSLLSGTPIFSDTRANTGAYQYYEIPETLDQPFTVENYFLHKRNISSVSYTPIVLANASGHVYTPEQTSLDSLLFTSIRNTAVYDNFGYRIRHGINTAGNTNGTGMTDTRLNGAGNYQTYFVNGDDYRAQEFPDGSAVAVGTYYLRTRKA